MQPALYDLSPLFRVLLLGGLIASVILSGRAISPLASIMSLASRYQQAKSSLETLDGLMKRPRDRVHGRTYVVPEPCTAAWRPKGWNSPTLASTRSP